MTLFSAALLTLAALIMLGKDAEGVKCYTCGGMQSDCKQITDCGATTTVCSKMVAPAPAGTTKVCGGGAPSDCVTVAGITTCICAGELCNGGVALGPAGTLGAGALLAAVVVFFHL